MKVYIAVDIDSGWDNVIGVFDTFDKAFAACRPTYDEWNGERGEWYRSRVNERTGIYEMHRIHCKEVQ